jgi:thioredoxin reductase
MPYLFVATGYVPTTKLLEGVVDFDPDHSGHLKIVDRRTETSVLHVFAAGGVSRAVDKRLMSCHALILVPRSIIEWTAK